MPFRLFKMDNSSRSLNDASEDHFSIAFRKSWDRCRERERERVIKKTVKETYRLKDQREVKGTWINPLCKEKLFFLSFPFFCCVLFFFWGSRRACVFRLRRFFGYSIARVFHRNAHTTLLFFSLGFCCRI